MDNGPGKAEIFSLHDAIRNPLARTVLKAMGKPLRKVLALDRIDHGYRSLPGEASGLEFLSALRDSFGLRCEIAPKDLANIPKEGPLVVVANHPFGAVEGILLADMLLSVRPDTKVMANHLLGRIRELRDLFILVDPFGAPRSLSGNIAPLRESVKWLRQGGCLGVFPAGEVAHFTVSERRVAEPRWSPTVSRIITACGATVVPVHFLGANGPVFHLAGMVHPRLRTALLAREFLNKSRKMVRARIGQPIPASRLEEMSDRQAAEYLRLRTVVLGGLDKGKRRILKPFPVRSIRRLEALGRPQDPWLMAREIACLPEAALLVQSGEFQVFEAESSRIPLVLAEIGRLREATFRKVGEGTGKSCDLDRFDGHYSHVFIWNSKKQEVVGAYRLGRSDRILSLHGPSGLYVTTLFKMKPFFLHRLGPALEMGRSFVRVEYQKSYNALLLLWKGIGSVVAREPKYRFLFGPVSITNDYQPMSRRLMAGWFEPSGEWRSLARLVKPRAPLKVDSWLKRAARTLATDVESLSELVSSVEADRKGVPVLLRQYLKLGGQVLSFNVDHDFNEALDGLIVVDLLETQRKHLERYLGKEGTAGFLEHHLGGFKQSA